MASTIGTFAPITQLCSPKRNKAATAELPRLLEHFTVVVDKPKRHLKVLLIATMILDTTIVLALYLPTLCGPPPYVFAKREGARERKRTGG